MLLFAGKGIRSSKVERHIETDDEYDDIKPIPIWMTVAAGIGVVIVFSTMAFTMIYAIFIGIRELLFR